jgi:hypothetical protein
MTSAGYVRSDRLGQHGMVAMQACVPQVSLWVAQFASPVLPCSLAPFAREVLAVDKRTVDRVTRWFPPLRSLPPGSHGLLPGRRAGLCDVRTQRWRRVEVLPEARAMPAPCGKACVLHPFCSVIGGDVACTWVDELTTAGFFWISRHIAPLPFPFHTSC